MSCKRKTTLACLVFELSALDLVPYSKPCPGHNSLTVWNRFMKLYRCMHDIETLCHEKGRHKYAAEENRSAREFIAISLWALFMLPPI